MVYMKVFQRYSDELFLYMPMQSKSHENEVLHLSMASFV